MQEKLKAVFDWVNFSPWSDETPDDVVFECGVRAANDMMAGGGSQLRRVHRLAGQSGCGKTTQLLPAVVGLEEGRGNKPIVIAVRNFPKYHPDYDKIVKTVSPGEVRERTNGFALKCLAVALQQVLQRGFLVILDMTILDPVFEDFFNSAIVANNYTASYQIFAVSKQQSNRFIEKRRQGSDAGAGEQGKVVYNSTSDYFYHILPKGLEYLASVDSKSTATVWTAYDLEPIYSGNLLGACVALGEGRGLELPLRYSEEELRAAKLRCLNNLA